MTAKKANASGELQVSSDQLRNELIEIKERIGALETIASISNKDVVEKYVREHIQSEKAREILKECEEPRTREDLVAKFKFASAQALDHHLGPLRQAVILEPKYDDKRRLHFEWSKMFRGLPRTTRDKILKANSK